MNSSKIKPLLLQLLTALLLAVLQNTASGLIFSAANSWPELNFGALWIDILAYFTLLLFIRGIRQRWPASHNNAKPVVIVFRRIAWLTLPLLILFRLAIWAKVESEVWYTFLSYNRMTIYFLVAMFILSVYVVLDLGYELLDRWRTSQAEAERLERLHTQAQLENLKAQINPHFLFNSLNTLNALISEDANRARQFVRRLSDVYRYILEHREANVIELSRERRLFEDYADLCSTRFEDNFNWKAEWPAPIDDWAIPPMTLQILLENAVKHNVISADKPLHVHVHTENHRLIVSNNLQPKKLWDPGTGIGLKNIVERYAQLTSEKVIIQSQDNAFSVSLPLIRHD